MALLLFHTAMLCRAAGDAAGALARMCVEGRHPGAVEEGLRSAARAAGAGKNSIPASAVLAIAACSGGPEGVGALEQDAAAGDPLPTRCSQSAPVSLMTGGIEAMLVPDGFNTEKLVDEGWTQLHANLLVAGI